VVLARCWALRNQARDSPAWCEPGGGGVDPVRPPFLVWSLCGRVGVGGWGVWYLDSGREHLATTSSGARWFPWSLCVEGVGGCGVCGCCLIFFCMLCPVALVIVGVVGLCFFVVFVECL